MDIAAQSQSYEEQEQRSAELDRRDREHGGIIDISEIVADQHKREVARDWRAYKPSVTPTEVRKARQGEEIPDHKRIDASRLILDCKAAVKRFTRLHRFGGVKRPETIADILATDTAMLILEWSTYGGGIDPKTGKRSAIVDLGGAGNLPARRVWLEATDQTRADRRFKLTASAWRCLLAAVKQAARSDEIRAELEWQMNQEPTEELDLTREIEQQQRDVGTVTRLPDVRAPEILRDAMEVSLDAARAIVGKAYPLASYRDLAESWGISESSLKVSLSRGAATVRKRYPDPTDLLEAIDLAAVAYRQQVLADAAYAVYLIRSGNAIDHPLVASALADWRSMTGELSPDRRALLVAAMKRRARADRIARRCQRSGQLGDWQGFNPEAIAGSVERRAQLVVRAARASASAARSSHLDGHTLSPAPAPHVPGPVEQIPFALRLADYRRAAADDRAYRV